MLEFDYVITGAGTAGCVLANRLSADPNRRVALLEAGGRDNWFWIRIPIGYLYTINNPRTDWCYKTEPDPGLNGRSLNYARGRVLGGCSSINAMIYMRGQKTDFDHWAQLGNRGWGWDEVLPVFKRSEDYQHGADAFHGSGGELRVEERRVDWEILDAFREAAATCGIPKIREFNRGDNLGCAYFQMNQKRGQRWSAARAWLDPAAKRPNLQIFTEAEAEQLCLTAGGAGQLEASGVRARIRGEPVTLRAKREVILAAGALGSPQLLERSGIGDGALLQKLGMEVQRHLPGVGRNLQDHLQLRTIYQVQNTLTLNRLAGSLLGRISMGLSYALFRTGPLTMPPSQLGAFARSNPGEAAPDLEWHVQPLSLDSFGEPLHPYDAITPSVCQLRPESRGEVHIRDRQPGSHPAIVMNYLSAPADQEVAVRGLRFTRRIMAAEPLQKFQPEELRPGPEVSSDEALLDAARELGTTIFHPVGSCKMGRDPDAVVDDRLNVRGVQRLRVIDASIMPTITSGNTNAPTVMIAEKGADFILQQNRN